MKYTLTVKDAGTDDAQDSDANQAMLMSDPTDFLNSGEEDLTLDAGFYVKAKVGDFVWEDLNGNGIQDAGEPGIENVPVTLTGSDNQGNPVNLTTNTAATGMYMFGDLVPGTYQITFGTPAGYDPTPADQGNDDAKDSDAGPMGATPVFTVSGGDTIPDFDAGFYQPAAIGNYVWEDLNADGIQNDGPTGIAGVEVILSGTDGAGNAVNASTTTDGNGYYLFSDLAPGSYKLTFVTPSGGYVPTNANDGDATDGTDSDADPAMGGMTVFEVLTSGESNPDYDAGYYLPASIGNYVWEDEDADGIQDPGEPGIGQATVTLTGTDGQGNPVNEVTTTDVDGSYLFDNLVPGSYKLTFTTPTGGTANYTLTLLDQGGNDAKDSDADPNNGNMTVFETLTSGEFNPDYDAGFYECPKIYVLDLPGDTVCPGSVIGAIHIITDPEAATISWTGGEEIGLADGSVNDHIVDIPAFVAKKVDKEVTITVTATLGDCVTQETFTITVMDQTPPYFENCPSDITLNNDPGKCGATVFWTKPVAEDDCGLETVVQSGGLATGSYFSINDSPHEIEYTAIDYMGNETTCRFTVTIQDLEKPDIECPEGPVYVETNEGCSHHVLGKHLDATVTDNCQGTVTLDNNYNDSFTLYDEVFDKGVTQVTWLAEDGAGNTALCTVTVIVVDHKAPQVQACPGNITVDNEPGICGADIDYTVLFTDNCDGDNLLDDAQLISGFESGHTFPVGTTAVEWWYFDEAGNGPAVCAFNVTVHDVEDPQIECVASNITVNIDGTLSGGAEANPQIIGFGPCGVTLQYDVPPAYDNCDGVIVTLQSGLGAGPNFYEYGGLYTETYNAYDAVGNVATCSFTIEVLDPVTPTITCPEDVTVNSDQGECDAVVNYAFPYFGDNCPGYGLTQLSGPNSGSEFPVGTTAVSFQVTDASGNTTTCAFTVTVEDKEKPELDCPADLVVSTSTNGTGDCSGAVPDLVPGLVATDNCGVSSTVQSPAAGSSFGSEHGDMAFVTLTVTDIHGNTQTCKTKLSLQDDEAPSIDCNVANAFDNTPGICGHLVDAADNTDPVFGDNCEGAQISHDYPAAPNSHTLEAAKLPVGTTTVIWTATDAAGNTTTCAVEYTVSDNILPEFVNCPSNAVLNNDIDKCGAQVIWPDPIAKDECGATVTQTGGPVSGQLMLVGTHTITYVATDPSGNTALCSWTITVNDAQLPDIECPAGIQYLETNNGNCSHTVSGTLLDPSVVENCAV
ncbi:MAG: HYR domain-containing protein, partial [Saprospiraceae bacterium]|nr:HYR domain-containing protein [Saprospiraceae bacterium]